MSIFLGAIEKTLLKDIKVGKKFYILNKRGTPKSSGKMTFVMVRNNGSIIEYDRLENDKRYVESTRYKVYGVIID
jgi:hypothetical protein